MVDQDFEKNKNEFLDIFSKSIRIAPVEFNNKRNKYFNGQAGILYTISQDLRSEKF